MAEEEGRQLLWSCPVGLTIRTDRDLLKQILFNLVNKALGHGTGDILLRVRVRAWGAVILVGSRCPVQKGTTGLGIGLRLVRALAEQLPETHLATRQTAYFWVRTQVPYGTPVPVQLMNAAVSA